jgi:glycerophosphoryl diester phosphodiesterase
VLWPQNTMLAFQGAVDLGYRYVETDVHLSRDGRVVVFHDDALGRLTDGAGMVWEHDWADLRKFDAAHTFGRRTGYPFRGAGVGIPSLEEVLTAFPDLQVNIDLKQAGMEQALADELERLDARDRVLIGSFFDDRIAEFRRITSGQVATSAGPMEARAAFRAAMLGRPIEAVADAFQVPTRKGAMRVPNRRFIEAVHAAGRQIHVWTVNTAPSMRRLLDAGVDGIVTDRPDLLNEVVTGRSPS